MSFTAQEVAVRALCNGALFVSSVILLCLFASYFFHKIKFNHQWYKNIEIQAAGSIIVLLIGHSIRAASDWLEFSSLRGDWHSWLFDTVGLFILSTVVVIAGKMLMVLTFSPFRWRWHIAIFLGSISLLIPLISTILNSRP